VPDFAGKPRICVIEGRIVESELAGPRAPLAGPQSVGYICETKDEQSRAPGDLHGEGTGVKRGVAERSCGG
jgi:hypothetical protein